MASPAWLPDIITLGDFGGEWDRFFPAVYEAFHRDFVRSRPMYAGERLALKRHPVILGKEATFWHLTSEGKIEDERLVDIRRCERIAWPRQIIDHSEDDAVKVWSDIRNGETRTILWLEESDYAVVLAERNGFTLVWTAYVVKPNRAAQFRREYQAFGVA